jgi:hypothetical protein
MKKLILAFLLVFMLPVFARAATCPTYPFTLTNGQIADANQVMANFNSILNCANSSLQPTITFPISIANGGSGQTTAGAALTAFGGLAINNNLSDLGSVSTARTNLGLGTAALANTGTSGHALPFLDGSNTWSNNQTINGANVLDMDGAAGTNRAISFTTSGSTRWIIVGANSVAEGGGNTGSNLGFNRYTDAGALIDTPFLITRATGLVTMGAGATIANGLTVSSGVANFANTPTQNGVALVATNDPRFIGPTQNHQAGNYTLALTDGGGEVLHVGGDPAATYTIPLNASVAFQIVTKIELVNDCTGGAITLSPAGGVTLEWFPSGGTGSRTLSACGIATLTKIGVNEWILTGVAIS